MSHDRVTDSDLLLTRLRAAHGEWVGDLYADLRVMIHSRVSDLRKRGFKIECRRVGQGKYEYRLVEGQ